MKKGKAGFENKGLVILLCVLVVAIAVLGVGIGVVFNGRNEVQGGEEVEFELSEELRRDNLSPEDQVIKEVSLMMQDSDSSVEDVEAYYDGVIGEAVGVGDTKLAVKIVVQKMNFLAVMENDCEKAENYVDNLDLYPYSVGERQYLASYVISMANGCGNQDLQNRWEDFYFEEGNY